MARGRGAEVGMREPRAKTDVPEHDKDVCHMVHPAFVDVLKFFVGRGHK